jgi:hypothetical protein
MWRGRPKVSSAHEVPMKSQIAKVVRESLETRLRERLPQFEHVATDEVPAGCRVYGSDALAGLSCYLLLLFNPKDDQFTIEAAWSRHGQFPSRLVPGQPLDVPERNIRRDPHEDGAFRFRISRLWFPKGDPWWDVVANRPPIETALRPSFLRRSPREEISIAEATIRASTLVDDAIEHIEQQVIPYFHQVARELALERHELD